MSFSGEVKAELCHVKNDRKCCERAECYGMLLFAHSFRSGDISLKSEQEGCVYRYAALLRKVCGIDVRITKPAHAGGLYTAFVAEQEDRDKAFSFFFHKKSDLFLKINRGNFEDECCVSAFLRGAFLACGSVSDPERDYHLEFLIPHKKLAEDLLRFIGETMTEPKITERKSAYIVYYKESTCIEDFLTLVQATNGSMRIMEIKVMKAVRNHVNRTTNCLTANITKTLKAVERQKKAIETIEACGGLEILPPELYELAVLRRENEDASLSELGTMLSEHLSRSGVNHRLNKIIEISQRLLKEKESSNRE